MKIEVPTSAAPIVSALSIEKHVNGGWQCVLYTLKGKQVLERKELSPPDMRMVAWEHFQINAWKLLDASLVKVPPKPVKYQTAEEAMRKQNEKNSV